MRPLAIALSVFSVTAGAWRPAASQLRGVQLLLRPPPHGHHGAATAPSRSWRSSSSSSSSFSLTASSGRTNTVAHASVTECEGGECSPAHGEAARGATRVSVSGTIYEAPEGDGGTAAPPVVRLFTKHGCTLCDVAKGVLAEARDSRPHSLVAVDITDPGHAAWHEKYKYDIPVLHVGDAYWTKHRVTAAEVDAALAEAAGGSGFVARKGEPDAARLERS